jgi:Transcriptional regulator, AbiEi antitoxin
MFRSMVRRRAAIPEVAEDQWGLITRRQLEALGIQPATLARLLADGTLERVTHGVYRVRGAGEPDHVRLRAAWLALDPEVLAWQRLDDPDVALVSHASAADLYGVGDLRADVHEFTLPARRQTRRADVRLHRGRVPETHRIVLRGLPVTRAGWMIADLLADHVDPESVARITVEVIDRGFEAPPVIADRVGPFAARLGLSRGDGAGLLDELLTLVGYRNREAIKEART